MQFGKRCIRFCRQSVNYFIIALGEVLCRENQFTCGNKKCAAISSICNGVDECGDNSDEILPCSGTNSKILK